MAMSEYEDEVRPPTGLERLAGLLAATKENASAEISKLGSQVQALEVERRTLEAMLESCRDELGDANSLVEQLRLENTRKWRVEERDDWRALLDSMQADRTALQHQNDRLEAELTRCITALLSIFPSCSSSPHGGAGGGADGPGAAGGVDEPSAGGGADDCDHPPELTARDCGRPGGVSSRAIAAVDLEWLSALAKEHNVVYEEPAAEDDDVCEAAGEKDAAGGGARANTGMIGGAHRGTGSGAASPTGGGDPASECLRLRVELDTLKHESQTAKVALESQVFEQEQELNKLRLEVSRSRGKGPSLAGTPGGGRSLAGVFRWWRQDAAAGRKGSGGGAKGRAITGAVTVV